ncbi:MAG: sulfatase-like hydrolase/transferase [Myxococcota bacterium]
MSVGFALLAASLGACTAVAPQQPDILLVLVPGVRGQLPGETVSAESALVSVLGTPRVRYSNAITPAPAPYAAFASLLTGMYPSAIPICNELPRVEEQPWCTKMPEQRYTLPSILGMYGYEVGLVHGKMEGAELFTGSRTAVPPDDWAADWPAVADAAGAWWQAAKSPKMLVVVGNDLRAKQIAHRVGGHTMRERYLSMARDVANGVARVVAKVDAEYVFVTSLHGMSLREKTGLREDHDKFLDQPYSATVLERTIHVPLLVYGPEGPPEIIPEVVELVDLLPTFCGLAGATPPANTPGMDLFAVGTDNLAYSEFGDWLAIRQGKWLLTFRGYLHNGSSLDPQMTTFLTEKPFVEEYWSLHDVGADPQQTTNRLSSDRPVALELRPRLVEMRTTVGTAPPDMMPDEKVQLLRLSPAQGYW